MGHMGLGPKEYAEVEFYEKLFSDLPEHIRALAGKLAVKQMLAAKMSRDVEDAQEKANKIRTEFAELVEEVETIKLDLRQKCHDFVNNKKENK